MAQARIVAVHQEGGDAAANLQIGVGDGEDDVEVGNGRVGDEVLGAVQDPLGANLLRRGLDAACVGARAGFGQAEGGNQFAAGEAAQVFLLLFWRAVIEHAARAHAVVDVHHQRECNGSAPIGHADENVFQAGEAVAAVFAGHGEAEVAHLTHAGEQVVGDAVGGLDLLGAGLAFVVNEVDGLLQKGDGQRAAACGLGVGQKGFAGALTCVHGVSPKDGG
ncbi:hypothetical protein SDC9_158378 [bioreactor metagenome]|uniref:Uncharacterized protein n=1 Tax=bioreactor metagenome TaxID=1076179 RepID=A0A645FA04_9ZZZZ